MRSTGKQSYTCALCRVGRVTERGHIIPHFVYRHMVKTSPTRFLRGSKNPNTRSQDGETLHFLCPVCEDLFSKWEKVFARNVFHPLHKHQNVRHGVYPSMNRFVFGDWLLRFCVSVSWRSLYFLMTRDNHRVLPHGQDVDARAALEVWRQYLIGERNTVGDFEQHLTIVGIPSETIGIRNTPDLGLYFERATTNGTWHDSDEGYVFTKMCRVIIAGTMKDTRNDWKGTLVPAGSGLFSSCDQVLSGLFNSWLRSDLADLPLTRARVSEPQRKVIDDAIKQFFARIAVEKERAGV